MTEPAITPPTDLLDAATRGLRLLDAISGYFEGNPHYDSVRAALRAALAATPSPSPEGASR